MDRGVAGSRHLYDAMAPLVGVLLSEPPVDLGRGVSLVRADVRDIAAGWPEASLLVPPGFGGEPDRRCALAVTLELDPGERPPRLAELVEDAVRALRLVSGTAIATGPVGFERIDGGPRPPVALSADSSHHVEGAYYRFDSHLLVVARATAQRIGALDPRDPRREALGLFERALTRRRSTCAPTSCATRWASRCAPSAPSHSPRCAPERSRAATPASASASATSSRATSSTTKPSPPPPATSSWQSSSTSRTPTPWRPPPTRYSWAHARARTWCRPESPTSPLPPAMRPGARPQSPR